MERDDARAVVAGFLSRYQSGDREAFEKLVAVAYRELRRAARQVVDRDDAVRLPTTRESLSDLYTAVAGDLAERAEDRDALQPVCWRAMRLAIVDHMRTPDGLADAPGSLVVAVHDLLDPVERFNWRLGRVVDGLYFASLSEAGVARALRLDPIHVRRDWQRARSWIVKELPSYSPSADAHEVPVPNAAWVDAVFDDALALPVEERTAFLERCAAVSPSLRRDVDELLRLNEQGLPGFEPGALAPELSWGILAGVPVPLPERLEEPVAPASATSPVGESDDSKEADGRRQWIGNPGEASSPLVAHSLQALRQLSHPNIAGVLETGQAPDGRAYLVTERIDGRPIDQYCDEELLSIEARLDLFLDVCAAVQYGHRRLVAHGAIEPSTVIVTAAGEVKLLDYGVAPLRHAASGVGVHDEPAPEYASPEEVRGEPVTVASDVYRLGLLLYELLIGERAQRGAGSERIVVPPSARVRSASEKQAAVRRLRAGALARRLRGDLDAIVLYALRKPPERRYPSVSALRSDVQRHRAGLPIWIRSDSLTYRAVRLVRRQRVAIAAAALAVVAAAALLPEPVRERLRQGQENARVAQVEQVLEQMLGTAAPAAERPPDALQFLEGSEQMARAELGSEPRSRARVLTSIGRAYAALGHYDRAIETLEEALTLRRAQFGDDGLEVAETLEALGEAEHRLGRYDEAEQSLRTVLSVRQVRAPEGHPSTIAATLELGSLLHSRGQLREAEQLLRRALSSLRPEVKLAGGAGSSPAGPDAAQPVNTLLPRALRELAGVLRDRGIAGESATLYAEAISRLEHLERESGPELPLARIGFARLLIARGELEKADAELALALQALRRVHQAEHPSLALALETEGLLRMEQDRLPEAVEQLRQAERIREAWLGPQHPSMLRPRALQAELARRQGRVAEAVAGARRVLGDYERLGLAGHPHTIEARLTLGDALVASGERDQAIGVLRPALATAERLFARYDPRIMRLEQTLAGR